ncbi:response regulator transcription factor [Dyadobacter aurulentus]|uniref:response regulator transcription factor n=1 Tax=Dyadobacter sp. UC 10 TaxID=2605428 RepID=UPI0011F240BD|nr:response regulator transcription factor [Dyadobacter sp. UC 10]KAA0992048.1 response regulator transcription factor [Dyadobacter sp. UC 10]
MPVAISLHNFHLCQNTSGSVIFARRFCLLAKSTAFDYHRLLIFHFNKSVESKWRAHDSYSSFATNFTLAGEMKNILIAEDHPIMRSGTRQIVHTYMPGAVITEVDTFKKALLSASEKTYDLAILDIGIPGGNSVKMIENFKEKYPAVKVLIFSSYDEDLYALPCIKAGADGYISKDAPEQEFKTALETIMLRKKIYLSERLKDDSLNKFINSRKSQDDAAPQLSIREREIAQLLLSGKGVSEIAGMLDVHISTVSTHRASIFKKMQVQNIIDLAKKFEILK